MEEAVAGAFYFQPHGMFFFKRSFYEKEPVGRTTKNGYPPNRWQAGYPHPAEPQTKTSPSGEVLRY